MRPRPLPALLAPAAAALGLALLPPTAASQSFPIEVSGVVLDPAGAPVPCCEVLLEIRGDPGDPYSIGRTRTRGDGSFRGRVACVPTGGPLELVAVAACCGGESAPIDVTDCVDPDCDTLAADDLTWGNFFITNLIPVTLGNIIGGVVFVAFAYWYVHLKGRG